MVDGTPKVHDDPLSSGEATRKLLSCHSTNRDNMQTTQRLSHDLIALSSSLLGIVKSGDIHLKELEIHQGHFEVSQHARQLEVLIGV